MIGGGPGGSCAALSAFQRGASVSLYEKSSFPRHKVCGEFLSAGVEPVLRDLGVWERFCSARPARITHLDLTLGTRTYSSRLPSPSFGLSRFALDHLLLEAVRKRGATLTHAKGPEAARPVIVTSGRHSVAQPDQKGNRLFGFKAHFAGPAHDAVELYFFDGCYVGLNAVENGITNVCGLGPEHVLKSIGFQIDDLLSRHIPLRRRLEPLSRQMNWMSVGPLLFRNRLGVLGEEGVYLAGDALSFVDPFTGSGMLSAMISGTLAGRSAAEGLPVAEHLSQCRKVIASPFRWASLLRWVAGQSWSGKAAALVPGPVLYRITRPHLA